MKQFYASLLGLLASGSLMAASLPSAPPVIVDFTQWDQASFSQYFKVDNVNGDEQMYQFIVGNTGAWPTWPTTNVRLRTPTNMTYTAADDWLLTNTPIRLEAGKEYTVKVTTSAYNANDPETVGVYLGTAASAASMSITVVGPTKVATAFNTPIELKANVTVPTTGDYYLGIQNTSSRTSGFWSVIHGFEISSDDNVAAPAKPAAPVLVADKDGKTEVKISTLVPELDVLGHKLPEITSLELYRDRAPLGYSWTNCTPGQMTAEFVDNASRGLTEGIHLYQVKAYNSAGESVMSDVATVYVGINVPGMPQNATLVPGSKDGEVKISWEAPTYDADNYIQNGALTYSLYSLDGTAETLVADNLSALTYTHQAVDAQAAQKLVGYRVYASSAAGKSAKGADTPVIPAGKTLEAPYADSFANGEGAAVYEIINNGGKFELINRYYDAQDDDNGLLAYTGAAASDKAEIRSAYINVPANGLLSFYYSGNQAGNSSSLTVTVDAGEGFAPVATLPLAGGSWELAMVDLKAYAGKRVRFGFAASGSEPALIDNLKLAARAAVDVAVVSLTAPASVKTSVDNTVSVKVASLGTTRPANAVVTLLQDGVAVGTATPDFSAGDVATVNFTLNVHVSVGEAVTLTAEATAEGDADESNNASNPVEIEVILPQLPSVSDLKAEGTDASVTLTWSKPSFEGVQLESVVEDFESYAHLSEAPGLWTLLDEDGVERASATYAGGHIFNGITGEKGGFFVLDTNGLHESLTAASGSNVLCSVAPAGSAERDEWIISPELDGSEQTIVLSFCAPMLEGGTVRVELCESSTGTAPADFTMLQRNYVPGNSWRSVRFIVNEETTHFAIHCVSDTYADVLIDDITYRPSAAASGLEMVGYNVYCDNQRLNSELLTAETFVHENVPAGEHKYYVTCVTNGGIESPISNVALYGMAGIESIALDTQAVEVYTLQGIRVTGAITPGIYIVRKGGVASKILVK